MTELEEEDYDARQPDLLDKASAISMHAANAMVRVIQGRVKQVRHPDHRGIFEDIWCEDCGEEIEEARMRVAINNNLCIYCATNRERKEKMK